jgi:hypothetical protein
VRAEAATFKATRAVATKAKGKGKAVAVADAPVAPLKAEKKIWYSR